MAEIKFSMEEMNEVAELFELFKKSQKVLAEVEEAMLSLDAPGFECVVSTLIDLHSRKYNGDSKQMVQEIYDAVNTVNDELGPMA